MPSNADHHYWSIDIPGLSEDEANQLVEWAESNDLGFHGSADALDPATVLTLHLDTDSARMLYDGLMSNPETATPEYGIAGIIGEWLNRASDTQ